MSFHRYGLILGFVLLAAAGGVLALFLLTPPWVASLGAVGLVFAAAAAGPVLGGWLDARASLRIREMAATAGFVPARGMSTTLEAVLLDLTGRLERAAAAKAGFAALARPALVATAGGEIVAVTQGLRALEPKAGDGKSLDVLFGDGFMAAGGGLAEEGFIAFAGRRFDMTSRRLADDLVLVELAPSGHLVADDDLDTFVSAIAGGHTGIRFEARDTERSPVLKALGYALATFDRASLTLDMLLRGEDPEPETFGDRGLEPQLRMLSAEVVRQRKELGQQIERRRSAEQRLGAVAGMIRSHRSAATVLPKAPAQGTATMARSAGLSVTHIQAWGEERATGDIESVMAAIEDVSFRTNLVALNTAIEAARAGENGAGYASVADEVRALAQSTARSAREIRLLVEHGHGEDRGRSIEGSDAHLHNLSEGHAKVAMGYDRGSEAIEVSDADNGVSLPSGRVLLPPPRRPRPVDGLESDVGLRHRTGTR